MRALPENRNTEVDFASVWYSHGSGSPGSPQLLTTVDTYITDETGTADSEVDSGLIVETERERSVPCI
jgi:hypothetical protein